MESKVSPPPWKKYRDRILAGMKMMLEVLRIVAFLLAMGLVLAISIAVTFRVTLYLWQQIVRPARISIDKVEWNGKQDADLASKLRGRLERWSTSSAGVHDQPQEARFVANSFGRGLKELEDLQIQVAGVAISGVVGLLQKATQPPTFVLSGSGEAGTDSLALTLSLTQRGNVEKEWTFSTPLNTSVDAPATTALQNTLLSEAVFQIIYDLGRGSGPSIFMREAMMRYPNDRALASYVKGTHYMKSYLHDPNQEDLDAAIRALRNLRWEMPNFEEGLDLLALALQENRQEDEAIEIYDYLLGNSPNPLERKFFLNAEDEAGQVGQRSAEDKRRLLQLAHNRGGAYFMKYTEEDSAEALRHLEALLELHKSELEREDGTEVGDVNAGCQQDTDKNGSYGEMAGFAALALAEIGGIHGTFLAYLKPGAAQPSRAALASMDRFKKQYELLAPSAKQPDDSAEAKERRVIESLYKVQEDCRVRAEREKECARAYWESSEEARQRERSLERLLLNAQGYTNYLYALWTATSEKELRKQGYEAIGLLRQADEAQPNHYTVLQNLGRIYADYAFDPDGRHLATARGLFERSIELKANDYWGYQRLAFIGGRQMELGAGGEVLERAGEHIARSLALRPHNRSARLIAARLKMWEWSESAADDKPTLEAEITESLALAEAIRGDEFALEWSQIVWQAHRLRGFPGTAADEDGGAATADAAKMKFDIERLKLVDKLSEVRLRFQQTSHWTYQRRLRRLDALHEDVAVLEFEARHKLRRRF